jgi:hypothetical protein
MKQSYFSMLTLAAVVGSSAVALSQAAPTGAAPRIATIAFNAAVFQTNEAQHAGKGHRH